VSIARTVVDEVVLVGNREVSTRESAGTLRLADEPGFAGPLAGLVSLLAHAGDRWALLIACDMPLIEPELLHRLLHACDVAVDAAAFRITAKNGEQIPCCAAFHPRVADAVRLELRRSASLHALLSSVRCRLLEPSDWEAHCLRSFNTPAEYAGLAASGGDFAAMDPPRR
jgi:molybdopterin-guanine dinucleotide biosynthesis protein A